MDCVKTCFAFFLILTLVHVHHCGRYGGSSENFDRLKRSHDGYSSTRRSIVAASSTQHYDYLQPTITEKTPSNGLNPSVTNLLKKLATLAPPTTTERITVSTPWYDKGFNLRFTDLPPRPNHGGIYRGEIPNRMQNKYNYHYPGFYLLPIPHPQYGDYHPTYMLFQYTSTDTGDNVFGNYLRNKLSTLETPTYSHRSYYDGYRPRYDHYTIHHYYHNATGVPKEEKIDSRSVIGCPSESAAVCPGNTTSLCPSDGRLMCVTRSKPRIVGTCVDANNQAVDCIKSTITCDNNFSPECVHIPQQNITIDIPCVSKIEVFGQIRTINKTIVPNNRNFPRPRYVSTTPEYLVLDDRRKRAVPQIYYCATMIAVPASRTPTAGEDFLSDASSWLENSLRVVLNINE